MHGVDALREVQAGTSVPIAMDETTRRAPARRRAVCLKITRGGITGVLADARAARAAAPTSTWRRPSTARAVSPPRVHVAAALRITRSCGLATGAPGRSRRRHRRSDDRRACITLRAPGSVRRMAREWPETPDDPVDPALAPLLEAGEGESEGFDLAEADLIEHAEHGDMHSTDPIMRDAAGFDELLEEDFDHDDYAEADEEGDPDW